MAAMRAEVEEMLKKWTTPTINRPNGRDRVNICETRVTYAILSMISPDADKIQPEKFRTLAAWDECKLITLYPSYTEEERQEQWLKIVKPIVKKPNPKP